MKNKSKIFIMFGIAVVLIAAGVLTFVFWPKDNVKEVYTKAVKESLGLGKSESKDDKDGNMYANKILKMVVEYNDLIGETPKNNKFEAVLDGTKEEASAYILFDMFVEELGKNEQYEAIIENNKMFFTIKEVFDKYYYVDINENNDANNNTNKNTKELNSKIITDAFEEAFFDVVDGENINKDSKEVSINGKKYKSTKYSYTFTGNDMYTIIDNALKKIKEKDAKQYELITQSLSLEDLKPLKDMGNLFTYIVYLDDDDNVITVNLSLNLAVQEQNLNVIFAQQSVDGYRRFYVSMVGQRIIDIEMEEEKENKVSLSLSMMDKKIITGELVAESSKSMSFNFKNTKDLEVNVDIQGTVTLENDDFNILINSIIGEDINNEIKIIAEVLDEMPNYDVTNSAPFEEMNEEDKALLQERFGFITQYLQGNSLAPNYD